MDFEDLVPAGGPEVVTAEDPVFAPLGKVGVEPGGDGHHVGLRSQHCFPSLVCSCVLIRVTLRPGVPRECTVDVGLGESGGASTCPVRNEEAASVLFNRSPVTLAIHAFKGRDEGFAVVAELSITGCDGECVDGVGRNTGIPLAIGFVVEGQEEAEVAVVFGSLRCEVDGRGGVGVGGGDVQGEGVNADIGSFGYIV